MRLVEIKDVRVGQVYFDEKNGLIRVIVPFDDEPKIIAGNSLFYKHNKEIKLVDDFEDMDSPQEIAATHRLVGKLGITHRIEDDRLVEIPRDEFQVDDVVKWYEDEIALAIITGNISKCGFDVLYLNGDWYLDKKMCSERVEKTGIYGVTHEFVNDLEVQDENDK